MGSTGISGLFGLHHQVAQIYIMCADYLSNILHVNIITICQWLGEKKKHFVLFGKKSCTIPEFAAAVTVS